MTANLKRITPGDTLDGIPGNTWNEFVATAERVASSDRAGVALGQPLPGSVVISVQNKTGSTREIGHVYELGTLALGTESQIVAEGNLPTTDWETIIAVAIEPAVDDAICRCVVAGIAYTQLNVTDIQILTADISSGSALLASHLAGRFRLLNAATSTGNQSQWMHVNGNRQLEWTGVADGTITFNGTGTVDIDGFTTHSVTAHLDKYHGDESISDTKEVGVRW